METIKFFIVGLICILPFNFLRVFCYKLLPNYKIGKRVNIGFLNFIHAKEVTICNDVTLRGLGNIFLNLNKLYLDDGSFIGAPRIGCNLFRGRKKVDPNVEFRLGKCSHIELFHYFDICESVIIGNNTVLGGIKTVVWTHIFYESEFKPVKIGNNCFIGSNVLFNQGVSIADNTVIAMGSVVTKSSLEENCLIGGVPAKTIKSNYPYNAKAAFKLRGIKYWEEEIL